MRDLIEWLEDQSARTESYFQQVLIGEDLARLRKLEQQLATAPSLEAFRKEALYSGWSADDLRTHELLPALDPLIAALWASRDTTPPRTSLIELWIAFQNLRVARLTGCLSRTPNPVP